MFNSFKQNSKDNEMNTNKNESFLLDTLIQELECTIKASQISASVDDIPAWSHLKTGIALYTIKIHTGLNIIHDLQSDLGKVQAYFSNDNERPEITDAIGALNNALNQESAQLLPRPDR